LLNQEIPSHTFEIPDEVRGEAEPPATANVPYQWVIRRLNLALFTDSDAINYDAAASKGLRLVELAPNVQHVVGGTHNGLIVAMKDYVVIFDAPINEWQSRWTIDAAKAKYPGKRLKYLVLTHHHNDHVGGSRTYIAEGAELIVGSPNKAYMEKVFNATHSVNPDELQKHPKTLKVIEVPEQLSLKDQVEEIRLYKVANPHAQGMLIGYVTARVAEWRNSKLLNRFRKRYNPETLYLVTPWHPEVGDPDQVRTYDDGGVETNSELDEIAAQK
jgi:hypothetical protein